MKARWSKRRIKAALSAISAMLAGEEGAGDWPEYVTRADLEGAELVICGLDEEPEIGNKDEKQ